ncbi:MAG: hypothetical protein QXX68_00035 [Candidatus Pacearchaeota archaeon]
MGKKTLIEIVEVVPEIKGIEKVRDAAKLLENYPLYRPAKEFMSIITDCFNENGLPLNIFDMNSKAISLQTQKEKILIAKGKKYYFGYSFLEEGLRKLCVSADYAKRVPYLWPDILLGEIEKKKLVPLCVFVDERIVPVIYRQRFYFFGGESFS